MKLNFYFLILILFSSLTITAQSTFIKQFDHPSQIGTLTEATALIKTLDKGMLVSTSQMGQNGSAAIHKLDKEGNLQWQLEIPGYAVSICQMDDSTYFMTSYYNGLLTYLDKAGNVIWMKCILDSANNIMNSAPVISVWNDSVVLLIGTETMLWITKSGIIQNQRPGPGIGGVGPYNDLIQKIVITPQRNFYVYGGNYPLRISQFDSLGNEIWRKQIDIKEIGGFDLAEFSYEFKQQPNGDLIITAGLNHSQSYFGSFIACIDTAANLKWIKGFYSGFYTSDFTLMPDNSITLMGPGYFMNIDSAAWSFTTYNIPSGTIRPSKGFYSVEMDSSFFIASSGINLFTLLKYPLIPANTCINSISTTQAYDLDYTVTAYPSAWVGRTYNLIDTAFASNYRYTMQDLCLINNTNEISATVVRLFPNPVSDKLTIQIDKLDFYWQLYDMNARLLQTGNINEINFDIVNRGVYMLRIVTPEKEFVQKIIH